MFLEDQDHTPFFELCLVRRTDGEIVGSLAYDNEALFDEDSDILEDMVELTGYRVERHCYR